MPASSPKLRIVAATAAAGIVLGFSIGRATGPRAALPERAPGPEKITASALPAEVNSTLTPLPDAEEASLPSPAVYERWQRLRAQPASAARDHELVRTLEQLAAMEPGRARSLAEAETHIWRRRELARAVVRGWARADGAAAIAWVLQQPPGGREELLRAAFIGAAARPDELVLLAHEACAAEPAFAHDRGAAAIAALAQAGAFPTAAQFASAASAEHRGSWLAAAYARWAEHQPESAVAAAVALPDETLRRVAIESVVKSWAQTEPAALAEFARHMPAHATRTYALGEALRQWIESDPVGAAGWIDQWPANPELDDAVAAIAQQPYLATTQPEVAVSWAESISDPHVRRTTLLAVAREWAAVDRPAARRYVEQLPDVPAEERKDLLGLLESEL